MYTSSTQDKDNPPTPPTQNPSACSLGHTCTHTHEALSPLHLFFHLWLLFLVVVGLNGCLCPSYFPTCPLSLDFQRPLCLTRSAYGGPKRKDFWSGQTELSRNPISAACVTSTIFHNLSKLQFPHLGNESSGGSFCELFWGINITTLTKYLIH